MSAWLAGHVHTLAITVGETLTFFAFATPVNADKLNHSTSHLTKATGSSLAKFTGWIEPGKSNKTNQPNKASFKALAYWHV